MTDPNATLCPTTASVAAEERARRILDTLFGVWATIDDSIRLRPSKREPFRVTSSGTARTAPECVDAADGALAPIRARHAAWTAAQAEATR